MQIKFTRNTVADGRAVEVGEVADVSDREARLLVALRKAVPVEDIPDRSGPLTTDAAEGLVPEGKKFARKSKA